MATKSSQTAVVNAYLDILGRPPDPAGLAHYMNKPIADVKADLQWAIATGQENKAANQAAVAAERQAAADAKAAARAAAARPVTNTSTAGTTTTNTGTTNTNTGTTNTNTGTTNTNTGTTNTNTTGTNNVVTDSGLGAINAAAEARIRDVTNLYQRIFYRQPDTAGLTFYTTGGGKDTSLTDLERQFKASNEGQRVATLENLYRTYFNRAPDPAGIRYYDNLFGPEITQDNIFTFINTGKGKENLTSAATDFLNTYKPPGGTTPDGAAADPLAARRTDITNLYKQFFNRDPDPGGLANYLTGNDKDKSLERIQQDFLGAITRGIEQPTDYAKGLLQQQGWRFENGKWINPGGGDVSPPPGGTTLPPPPGGTTTVDTRRAGLTELYRSIFGRDPDQAGLDFYMTGGGKDVPLSRVSELFRDSPEFKEAFPKFDAAKAGLFPTQFTFPTGERPSEILGITGRPTTGRTIADLYQRFLGRAPDPAGLQFYAQKFGPTITPQGVSDFIGDIYGPRGEVAGLKGVLPELAYRGLIAPPQAPTLAYGSQEVSPFGFIPPTESASATPAGKAGGLVGYKEGGMPKLSAKEAGSQFDISEYIDPETGRFYINEYQRDVVFNPELREAERIERERMAMEDAQRRRGLASGGIIDVIPPKIYSARVPIQLGTPSYAKGGLASIAENLAEKGRGGDTMLVHMSPEEVQGINALTQRMTGRSLTINPKTGLPEAFAFLPALLGFMGQKFLGLTALKSAMLVGAGYALKYKSLKRGLSAGLGAYGGAQLGAGLEAAGAAATQGPPIVPQGVAEAGTGAVSPDFGAVTIKGPQVSGGFGDFTPAITSPTPATSYAAGNVAARTAEQAALAPGSTIERLGAGASNLMSSDEATRQAAQAAYKGATDSTPFMAASQVLGGVSMGSAVQEQDAFKAAQAARDREEEEKRRQYAELFRRTMPMAAGGGMVAFADGGMPTFEYGGTTAPTGEPRMVKGAGDGMSDNVPANIEGVQEARLANDEFVVPADVVADIGNGSSSAGAKKLYAMMDRIRKARHGTTEQPPEIEAERLMPA